MSLRLSATLTSSLNNVELPSYPAQEAQRTIVHLGIGAFHRAHQAAYTDRLNKTEAIRWNIIGCSLRSANVKQQLAPQDMLYTVLEKGVGNTAHIIGCIQDVLVGPENPSAIINAMADPATAIISLTVTEKGYCHFPASGELNLQHPDIQHDLTNLNSPQSAIGFIVAGLRQRFEKQLNPVTILSCDNLPHNGKVAAKVVTQFAQQIDPKLAKWIEQGVTFPCTMVDRIVPATTEEDIELCRNQFGYDDLGLVVAEPFTQWVIENSFCQDRPTWEKVGALLVDDVAIYETMKLRLLNGSHSLLAYAGFLAGCETVYETMKHHELRRICQRFMVSAAKSFQAPEGFDIEYYQEQLIERFSNPSLKHRTWQIAMDGSQKIPQRWLDSVRALLTSEAELQLYGFALAAWLRFVTGIDENGKPIEISDPKAEQFRALAQTHKEHSNNYVKAFLQQEDIFGSDLATNEKLEKSVLYYYSKINSKGIAAVLTEVDSTI